MSLHDLAVQLHKSVQELTTGVPGMSLHELTIEWPAYWAADAELKQTMQKLEGSVSPEEFDQRFEQSMGGGEA